MERFVGLSLAHTTRFLSLAIEILSSVVSDEKEILACWILKNVVSDKNLLYVVPAHSMFSSPARKIFVLSDKNRAVYARPYSYLSWRQVKYIGENESIEDL